MLRITRAYLAAGLLAVVAYAVLPSDGGRAVLYSLVGLSSTIAVVVAVRVHRPLRTWPWWLMAGGLACWTAADTLFSWYAEVLEIEPFPSAADALYLLGYPFMGLAFLLMVRGRRPGREREGLIDSLMLTVAVGLLSWVFLMRPLLVDSSESVTYRLIGMAYPLGDVLVFGVLARVLTTAGARTAAFRLLLGAGACLLAADVGFGLSTLEGAFFTSWVNMLYLASYVLWGAGALHPSMRATSEPAPEAAATFTRGRLTLLTVASLVAPGTLAAQSLLDLPLDVWAVVVSSVVLFLLVILRMSGLLRQVQEQAGQLADLARTDSLTGLPNRRTADAELERMVRLAAADGSPVTAAILDLDRFKAFNDTFGHQAGDRLLTESAAAWKGQLAGRQCVLARYGGEEFLVLSLGQDLGPFVEMLHRMRVATPAGQTFSAGAARWDGTETAAALLGRADVALYAAKRSGRDRVHTAQAAGVAAAR